MEYDVVIIGGGVAGTTAALGLQKQGLRAAMVEVQPAQSWRIGETLAAEAQPLLRALDLWEAHVQAGHLPSYGIVSTWGWDAAVEKDFLSNLHGHAWQLNRAAFESMLAHAAVQRGVMMLRGAAPTRFARDAGRWMVQAGGTTLQSRWLIDATGRRAAVARHLDVRREALDSLVAIYALASCTTHSDRDGRTHVESVHDGWFYTALVPDGRRTVSYQTEADLLPPNKSWRTKAWFSRQLADARCLSALLDQHDYRFEADPELTSAHSGRLEKFSGDGWCAIGDAAMSFDPITGHGLLKAMQSAMQAVQAIKTGTPAARQEFDRWNELLWQNYCLGRQACYSSERRWPDALFWNQRHVRS